MTADHRDDDDDRHEHEKQDHRVLDPPLSTLVVAHHRPISTDTLTTGPTALNPLSLQDLGAVCADQMRGMEEAVANAVRGLVEDYEEQSFIEACIARDADKLECLVQAREYVEAGYAEAQSADYGSGLRASAPNKARPRRSLGR